jgi:hypothetical protein
MKREALIFTIFLLILSSTNFTLALEDSGYDENDVTTWHLDFEKFLNTDMNNIDDLNEKWKKAHLSERANFLKEYSKKLGVQLNGFEEAT